MTNSNYLSEQLVTYFPASVVKNVNTTYIPVLQGFMENLITGKCRKKGTGRYTDCMDSG
jgi:hypothetical protein